MDLSRYWHASGKRILAGITGSVHQGVGQVLLTVAPLAGLDEHLVKTLMAVADILELQIVVGSCDTGQHVPGSRHYKGCAVDIIRIGAMGKPALTASLDNLHAVELYDYLQGAGWHIGEGGNFPGL